MLRVNALTGFGSGGSPPIEVLQRSSDQSSTPTTTFNLSCDIGTANSGRVVYAMVGAKDNLSFTIDSVTINSVSASQIIAFDEGNTKAEIWAASVPSGSGAQAVDVGMSSNVTSCSVATTAVINVNAPLVATFTGSDDVSAANIASVLSATAQAGGFICACAVLREPAERGSCNWTDITERFDDGPAGAHAMSAADDTKSVAMSATTISSDFTGSFDEGGTVVASFR